MTFSGPDQQAYKTLRAIDNLIYILEEEKQRVGQTLPAMFAAFASRVAHHNMM
jgi:hypothetical protein